jgi:hypothetical protein
VRDLVERSPISPGQRRQWNSSNRRISYYQCATTLDIQHPRSLTLALRKHNGIIIADAAKGSASEDRPSRLIICGEAERHKKVRKGAGGSSGTCVGRGIQAGRAWNGRGRIEWKGTQEGRTARRGEGRYLWWSRKAAGLSPARLPRSGGR